jgi:DNA repair protein RadC
VNASEDAFNIMAIDLVELQHEEFWALYLDRANNLIDKSRISQGGISGTVIDVRIIMKQAIEKLASSIVLLHNHPSGNLKPSQADIDITKKAASAAILLDMKVIDHLIIADRKFMSFADDGLL